MMSAKKEIAIGETGQRANSGNKTIWLRRGAFIALIAALVAVTTTVLIIGGTEPANAGFLGIPCW